MKDKMAASYGSGYHSPPPIGRPVDRVFEEAKLTGEVCLNGRKLREYPKLCVKYDLSDTVHVDVSRNRLIEVPHEVCEYLFVERLNCYHNVIRSIPEAIQQLQALTHLNLSRNQLTVLPTALCFLSSLEVLSVSNNKLVSLPEEIGALENLMDLDVSCNEISHLPPQIGDLLSLRNLNLRRNFLVELPIELSRLQLFHLDFSSNRIEKIPTVFRKMETLEQFVLDHNPLSSPPAYICCKGKQHIMKFLAMEAVKEDRKRGIIMGSEADVKRFVRKSLPPQQTSSEDFRNILGAPESKWKRHTVMSNDSGYNSTGDVADRNGWQSAEELKRQKAEYERKKKQAEQIRMKQQLEQEEEAEKEERRRAALRIQEEQRLLMERQAEETRRQQEEEARRKREEEEEEAAARKREEELRQLEEAVKKQEAEKEAQRQQEEAQRKAAEAKLAEEAKKSKLTNRLHQPPSSLPLHGSRVGYGRPSPAQPSASLKYRPSPQEDSYIMSENDYRNALSSQSLKEQRRLGSTGGTPYRRAASDTLKKPSPATQQVDNLNYINKNYSEEDYEVDMYFGLSETSRQSSASTTPSVSPSPSPRNSVSHLAKPTNSPSGSTSHIAKPNSPSSGSGIAKPTTGTKSSVPRAANGPTSASAASHAQALRRTKLGADRSNTSSPVTARSTRTTGSTSGGSNLRSQGSQLNTAVGSNLRRSSNSSTTDDECKVRKGPSAPPETSRLKSRLEDSKLRGTTVGSGVKKFGDQDNRKINTRPPTNSYGAGRSRTGRSEESSLTIRRREEHQREEAEQTERLRQTIESRLKLTLPDNLSEALRDGVVLCHLANNVRARSVGSIHVPSPAVPKLTPAKCRRNVDNFLEACRKIGVDQEQVCGPQDILEERALSRVALTVAALVAIGTNPKQSAV